MIALYILTAMVAAAAIAFFIFRRFYKVVYGCSNVVYDEDRCIACQKCVHVCPTHAVKTVPRHPHITPEYRAEIVSHLPSSILEGGPYVMAILNLSPNSFYSGSVAKPEDAIERLEILLDEGADIIDIGACSTKPGSEPVTEDEEWARLEAPLKAIVKKYPTLPLISIDTFRPGIIRRALPIVGAKRLIVNDVAGKDNDELIALAAEKGLPYIVTYNGSATFPSTSSISAPALDDTVAGKSTSDPVAAMVRYFDEFALKADELGLKNYILDPGLGFGGKSIEENYQLLKGLPALPGSHQVLVGLSRKSMIFKYLGISPNDSLSATTALHLYAASHGADILRVHDPLEARQAIKLSKFLSE